MINDEQTRAAVKVYLTQKGDDCLCQRTQPGTKWGEHTYCFCGCDLNDAIEWAITYERLETLKLLEKIHLAALRCQDGQFALAVQNCISTLKSERK